MKLDPVPMECAKCQKQTTHSVDFAKRSDADGTVTSTCEICGTQISKYIERPRGYSRPIEDIMRHASKFGSHQREIVKPKP